MKIMGDALLSLCPESSAISRHTVFSIISSNSHKTEHFHTYLYCQRADLIALLGIIHGQNERLLHSGSASFQRSRLNETTS